MHVSVSHRLDHMRFQPQLQWTTRWPHSLHIFSIPELFCSGPSPMPQGGSSVWCELLHYQEQKTMLRPQWGTTSCRDKSTIYGKWTALDPFYYGTGFFGIDTDCGYGFVFITWSTCVNTSFQRLGNCGFANTGSYIMLFRPKEPFYGKESVRTGSRLWDPLILLYTTAPWSSKLEQWSGHCRPIQRPREGKHPLGLECSSTEYSMCIEPRADKCDIQCCVLNS